GIVLLEETRAQKTARIKRELKRVGVVRFTDVLAMRLWQKLAHRSDATWMAATVQAMRVRYGMAGEVPTIEAPNVNDEAVLAFLRQARPDIVLARAKQLLKKKTLSVARNGTFVMHPGICPEYRNAHGCFWALARRDMGKVGMTLLKIDAGVDTGPVYGHYGYAFDERVESHVRIQYRAVHENLDAVGVKLKEIVAGTAKPVDTNHRAGADWGQPWLSRYIAWKRAARRDGHRVALMYHDVVAPGASDSSGFPGAAAGRYKFDADDFARHMNALERTRLDFGTLTPYALTFDDGGASAAAIGRELMRRDMRGHFFITTSRIGTAGFVDAHALRELHAAGHVVGSHSHTHPAEISRLSPGALDAEWRSSVRILEGILGSPVTVASIPGGFYSPAVAASAASAGIRTLFTSEPTVRTHRVGDCLVIGRYALWRGMSASVAVALANGDGLARFRQWLLWNTKKPLKRFAGPVYRLVRHRLMTARA
ncbi:polysaccharide deacetylase family protein, partial [Pinirhizobacter sp.]|uniref:polysaccharide deacetylase family protein n=1 Tax=Pinirhizobacter sp. TaxID=2950432 RepID=UPI002F40387A